MPQLDGTDVCRAARAASLPIEPYLLILTTRTNRRDVVAGLQAGADDYVTKPFDRVELQARLQVGLRVIRLQVQLTDRLRELEEGRAAERSLGGCCRSAPTAARSARTRTTGRCWRSTSANRRRPLHPTASAGMHRPGGAGAGTLRDARKRE